MTYVSKTSMDRSGTVSVTGLQRGVRWMVFPNVKVWWTAQLGVFPIRVTVYAFHCSFPQTAFVTPESIENLTKKASDYSGEAK